jgi:hypothetical protein
MEGALGEPAPSAALLEAVRLAVESGLETIRDQSQLVPMAILSCDGEYSLLAFDGLEETQISSALRKRLSDATPRPDAYVLRYEGEMARATGELADAIVVEGATPDMAHALMWGYPFGGLSGQDIPCLGPCESYYAAHHSELAAPDSGETLD